MKGNAPLVIFRSVARNAEKTIRRTISSVYAQTHKNWELHLVDNASTDGTLSIMEQYAAKDSRVRVFKNEGNYVWKKGNRFTDYYHEYDLENTYMCHIDADDEYLPEFAERMLEFARRFDLDIACCGYENIDARTGRSIEAMKVGKTLIIEGEGFDTLFTAYHCFARLRVAKLFRLTVTDKVVFTENVDILHGGDTVEALEYFRNARRIGICPEQYYIYYYYKSSIGKKWWSSRPKDDRTVYDTTIDYLMDKAGYVSAKNREFLHRMFHYAIFQNFEVIQDVQLPLSEKIEALHDIISCEHTRELVKYLCTSAEATPGDKLFADIANWLKANTKQQDDSKSAKMLSDIFSVIGIFSDDYFGLSSSVMRVILTENAKSVLEISGFDARFGELIKHSQADVQNITLDRVDLTDGAAPVDACTADGWYDNIYGSDTLSDISSLKQYDVIIVFHLFENMENTQAKELLERLLTKANKQVLVLTPEYSYDLQSDDENKKSDFRAYHPLFFLGMDLSYKMLQTSQGQIQAYSFFPPKEYAPLPCDALPGRIDKSQKLRVAYVLFNHGKSGAIKAIFEQIKALSKNGHIITVYCRELVEEQMKLTWDIPAGSGVSRRVVVPDNADFLDYIDNQDIIILSWWTLTPEFENSKIPVALWEQGSEAIYGDYYGQLQSSGGEKITAMHTVYRKPVSMLAVSHIVQTVLKGRYNRGSQLFPAGIDTDFYHPGGPRKSELPIVLLTGSPGIPFKGFPAAFSVLDKAYRNGNRFLVRLATAMEFILTPQPVFPFEVIIDPPQEQLAKLYRDADIFLSTSIFETFSLPPLEAMASGTAVISTDNGGINIYAKSGENCLLCRQGDLKSLLRALQFLLTDAGAREKLGRAGREAALKHNMQSILPQLEECLYKIAGR